LIIVMGAPTSAAIGSNGDDGSGNMVQKPSRLPEPFDEAAEEKVRGLLAALASPAAAWRAKEAKLATLAPLCRAHPRETLEAVLCSGPCAVLDALLGVMASERTSAGSKLAAADVLAGVCTEPRAAAALCPGDVVGRLMRCAAAAAGADGRAAAAHALWQLSVAHDFAPEVVGHAGSAFRVVEVLARDVSAGGSAPGCMCALRAMQHMLQAYTGGGSSSTEATDRIGARVVGPLCSLLDPGQPEAAAGAAQLLAMLSATTANRARVSAAGGVPRLITLLRCAGNNNNNTDAAAAGWPQQPLQQQQKLQLQQQEAAAAAALAALTQLARSDTRLCHELLAAGVVPGLLALLRLPACSGGALQLLGDLASQPDGRRALQYADALPLLVVAAEVGVTSDV
jgi:hypothetical protein